VRGSWKSLGVEWAPHLLPIAMGFLVFGRLVLPEQLATPWPHTMIGRWALSMAIGGTTLAVVLLTSRLGQRQVFLDQPPPGRAIPWWALFVLMIGLWVIWFVFPSSRNDPLVPLAFPLLVTTVVLAGGRSPRMAFALLSLASASLWLARLSPLVRNTHWWRARAVSVDSHASMTAAAILVTAGTILAGLAWRHRATLGRALLYGTLAAGLLGASGFEWVRHLDAMQRPRTGWDDWSLLTHSPSAWEWLPHLESLFIGSTLAALVGAFVVHHLFAEPHDEHEWRLVAPAALVAIASSQLHWSPRIPVWGEPVARTMEDYVPTLARGWPGVVEVGLVLLGGLVVLAILTRRRLRSELRSFEGLAPRGPAEGLPRHPRWLGRGEANHAWGVAGAPYRDQPRLVFDGPESVAKARRLAYARCAHGARTIAARCAAVVLLCGLGVVSAWLITALVRTF
jgi:hypothetical protein